MDAMETALDHYAQNEIDLFNGRVTDYNSRCGAFKYRQSSYSSAQRNVEARRSALVTDGTARILSMRSAVPATKPPTVIAPSAAAPSPSAFQIEWYKPATLQGIYHRNTFDNCCVNGISTKTGYNDLELETTADVTGATAASAYGVKHIQIGIKADQITNVHDGDKVTVSCKSIWEGSTGHYALPVYCDATSMYAVIPPTANDTQAQLNQKVATATGLRIARIDKMGNSQPITGGYISDTKFLVKLGDKIVFDGEGAAYMNFSFVDKLGDEFVTVLETSSGGNMCPSEQTLIAVSNGMVNMVKPFGNCSEPKIEVTKNQIKFTSFVEYGKRLVAIYKNQQLSESKVNLPLNKDSASSDEGYNYLLKYNERSDIETILLDSKLNPTLSTLMGADFDKLKDRLLMFSGGTVNNGFLILSGGMPHMFTSDEGYLAIALDGSAIYTAVLASEYNTETKQSSTSLHAYSSVPTGIAMPPNSMSEWFGRFKEVRPEWRYPANIQQNGIDNGLTN